MSFTSPRLLCIIALGIILSLPVFSQSQSPATTLTVPDEATVRATVEKYFSLYGAKDLHGLISLWSEKSPDYAQASQRLEKAFAAEDYRFSVPALSMIKSAGDRTTVRAVVNLTVTNLKTKESEATRMVRNITLIDEGGSLKFWRNTSAHNDLAEALVKASTDAERNKLLADEKELVTPELVIALNDQGDKLRVERNYAEASAVYILALKIADQIDNKAARADTMNNLGLINRLQGNFAKALEYHQQSLTIAEELKNQSGIATAENYIGSIYYLQGDTMQALEWYEKSLRIRETLGQKQGAEAALANIGNIHMAQGNFAQALENFQKSVAIADSIGNQHDVGAILNNIGTVYQSLGNYVQALQSFQKALMIAQAQSDKLSISITITNIGRIYAAQGNYDQALDYFERALKISEELGAKFGIALVLNNIGSMHRLQGNYADAQKDLQRSLTIREAIGDKNGIANTMNSLGRVQYSQGNYDQALETFQKTLTMREALGDKGGAVETLINLAETYQKQSRYQLALETGSRAAMLATQVGDNEDLWKGRLAAGNAYRALGDLDHARAAFVDAIDNIEALRAGVVGGSGDQQRFFESKVLAYHGLLELLVRENQPAEALAIAERAKARVLLDVLQTGRVNVTKSMTSEEKERELQLNTELVSLNTQVSRESARSQSDQARLSELKHRLQKARLEFEDFQTNLYATHPELRVQRGEVRTLRLDQLTALVPDATSALLEYVVTEEQTYLFVVTKAPGAVAAEVHVYTLPIKRDALLKRTEAFRQQLAGRDLGFRVAARELYDLLMKPAQAQLRGKSNLVIVPDDQLWETPFQALLRDGDRYVIETSAVAYAPSLSVLREMIARRNQRQNGPAGPALLALGNPVIGKETIERATMALRDEKLSPLPEAEQEVRALGQLYGSPSSRIYIGPEAREDRVKAEAGQARILHFATHGTLNNASPMYSHLVLAQGASNEDGLLEAWEVMQMDLKADLAVLSACETARGKFGAGEGMIGLTWAMFVAGVPSTLVSQWKVESASTRDLMLSFHRQLQTPTAGARASNPKAEALRQASLKLLKSPDTAHPFYWAGFVLIGDGR